MTIHSKYFKNNFYSSDSSNQFSIMVSFLSLSCLLFLPFLSYLLWVFPPSCPLSFLLFIFLTFYFEYYTQKYQINNYLSFITVSYSDLGASHLSRAFISFLSFPRIITVEGNTLIFTSTL